MMQKKTKIYYAHCMGIYDTPQEQRDIDVLQRLGFEVLNPNQPEHQKAAGDLKAAGRDAEVINYFVALSSSCDALAFRSEPSGDIPAGVGKELERARGRDIPIIELPSLALRRILPVAETRLYLHEIGQR